MNWEVRTMRSGTSCFNGTLYRKTMARFWPLWALYGLFWMFAIPLNLMNRYFNYLRWTGGTGTPQDLLLDLAQSIPEYLAPGVWLAALMGLLWAKNHTARQGRASAHMLGGSRASSTSTPHRATAATGSSRKDSPARYWVTNRVSRRMGRACIMQAERLL